MQIKGYKNAVMDFQKAQNRGNLEKCYEKKITGIGFATCKVSMYDPVFGRISKKGLYN